MQTEFISVKIRSSADDSVLPAAVSTACSAARRRRAGRDGPEIGTGERLAAAAEEAAAPGGGDAKSRTDERRRIPKERGLGMRLRRNVIKSFKKKR